MPLKLHAHPFSSYCQKVLTALYEAGTPFETAFIDQEGRERLKSIWPFGKFPVLVDEERGVTLPEASIIIEHLNLHYPGQARLLPQEPDLLLEMRLLDRVFDNYVSTPQQKIVLDRMRSEAERDPRGVEDAHAMIATAYDWLEARMTGRLFAVGETFTMADCAAGPFLFYADWVQPIGEGHPRLRSYLARLRARPSFARAVDEARPFRAYFPGGVPPHAD